MSTPMAKLLEDYAIKLAGMDTVSEEKVKDLIHRVNHGLMPSRSEIVEALELLLVKRTESDYYAALAPLLPLLEAGQLLADSTGNTYCWDKWDAAFQEAQEAVKR